MKHLHGTCRGLIPSKPLAPLSGLDGIGNKFNSCLAGDLANRTWSWRLHSVSQSSVNCRSSKRNGLISPLQCPPFHCHSFKTHLAVQWIRLRRTGFQRDQWAPDSCFSSISARAGSTKGEGMGGWQGETFQQHRSLTSASANNKTPSSASCP